MTNDKVEWNMPSKSGDRQPLCAVSIARISC